jgi:hypothetical protein
MIFLEFVDRHPVITVIALLVLATLIGEVADTALTQVVPK